MAESARCDDEMKCFFSFIMDLGLGVVGSGEFYAALVPIELNRSFVQSLLPANGLRLSEDVGSKKAYPVFLIVGEHENVRTYYRNLGGCNHPFISQYNEAIFLIPKVQIAAKRSRGRYSYMAKLFLDKNRPIWAAAPYGYPKYQGSFEIQGNTTSVCDREDNIVLSLETAAEPGLSSKGASTSFSRVTSLLDHPNISVHDGRLVCADFEWGFGRKITFSPESPERPSDAETFVRPVTYQLDLFGDFFPDRSSGDFAGHYAKETFNEKGLGAFEIATKWTLSSPRRCKLHALF